MLAFPDMVRLLGLLKHAMETPASCNEALKGLICSSVSPTASIAPCGAFDLSLANSSHNLPLKYAIVIAVDEDSIPAANAAAISPLE